MKKLLFLLPFLFLFSCGNKEEIPELKTKSPYMLDEDVVRFVGNTAIPDFKFNEKFMAEKKVKAVSIIEKAIENSAPADTFVTSPLMVWLLDSAGMTKELQLFDKGNKVFSEYYLLPEELQLLGLKKDFDIYNSAVTVFNLKNKLIQSEIRTEPANADTTKYFYDDSGHIDSVSVRPYQGPGFYVTFEYFDNGVVKKRKVREDGTSAASKDWSFEYDDKGNLKRIKENQAGGGIYNFKWDDSGKLIFVEYLADGKSEFRKTYTYTSDGLLNEAVLEIPGGKRILTFGYAK